MIYEYTYNKRSNPDQIREGERGGGPGE